MKCFYSLRIDIDDVHFDELSAILGVRPSFNPSVGWIYEVVKTDDDDYFDFGGVFLSLLENKYKILEKIGVKKEDITFWIVYEYDEQCNLEMDPGIMARMGNNGIKLCISCYDSGRRNVKP